MVTHIHPDHYGLAGRIREASGAWISLHPADAELIHDRYDEPDDLLDRVAAALRRMGAPAEELEPLRNAAMPVRPLRRRGRARTSCSRTGHGPRCRDGTCRPSGPRATRRATCASTRPRQELMLSGDHVLPRITPNIPFHPQAGANPLGDYLQSLDKLEPYEVSEVLPGPRVPLRRSQDPAGGAAPAPPRPLRRGDRRPAGRARTAPGTSPRT